MTRTLERDQDRMYVLSEAENGDIVLNVVAGGIGMYEVALTLNAEERAGWPGQYWPGAAGTRCLTIRVI